MTSAECEYIDIYGALPNSPCIEDTIKEFEEAMKVVGDEVTTLKENLDEFTTERNELEFKNKNLRFNTSTMHEPATAEIERIDKMWAQLKREYEEDSIIFRRQQTEFDQRAPDKEQRLFHHPAPGRGRTEFHHPEKCPSNKLTSHMYVPPEKVHTFYCRRRLDVIPENKKLISLDKSSEGFKHMAVIPWRLIPITFTERHKDINVKVHNNSAYLYKEYALPSQNETKSKRCSSQNCRYLPSARNVVQAETESEKIHKKRKEFNVHRSRSPPHTIPVSPSAGSKHGNVCTISLNLSEHSSFKRSKRTKIVKLNTGMKPSEARTTDLVKNTNKKLFGEHNQSGGMKRPLETKEADEVYLPDSKRQMLNDITGREWRERRNTSELLKKNKAERILSNTDKMVRNERS